MPARNLRAIPPTRPDGEVASHIPANGPRWPDPASLPTQVLHLPRREREVAIIIYERGPMTANEVQSLLPRDLSNSALRAMLMRLCRKDILTRRKVTGSHHPKDRRIPFIYSPAIRAELMEARAVRQIAEDYFDGSLDRLLCAVAQAMADHEPLPDLHEPRPTVPALSASRDVPERVPPALLKPSH